MEIKEILRKTVTYFKEAGVRTPRLDAEVLLADVLNKKRVDLYVDFDQPLTTAEIDKYRELVIKRKEGIPVAYLLGSQEFMSLDFKVTADVLIPRPETEHLVEQTLELIKDSKQESFKIADVGTGSGAIIISLVKLAGANISAVAVDISAQALKVALENAIKHQVKGYIDFKESDLLTDLEEEFDIIVSNPPYIPEGEMKDLQPEVKAEPASALVAGEDGLKYYKEIIKQANSRLKDQGYILFEVGDKQAAKVAKLLSENGFTEITITEDYAGIERIIMAKNTLVA